MDVGVVTRSFPHLSNAQAAELIAANGFRWVELCFSQTDSNYWNYNGRSDIASFSDADSKKVVHEYRQRGLDISALGVFTNLLEAEDNEWRKNMAYYERHMHIAAENDIPVVATECGFHPERRGIVADQFENDFARLKQSLEWLTEKAVEYDVHIALEPCVLDIVPSAKRTVDLVSQIGSDRLRILLDPANLIANNTEEEMFHHLADHVAYFHGKDRKVNAAKGCVVGDGDIDWPTFFALYRRHTPDKPFILEYVNEQNFRSVRDRVVQLAESSG